ncbi:MAG: hypothetical protein WCJ01_11775 [Ignavibacteria bacterium]
MGGKASLLLVLGFTLVFMVAGRNAGNVASSTTESMVSYYSSTKAHHLAVSGVNLVVNQLFLDATIADQTYSFTLDDGTISVNLSTTDSYKNIKKLTAIGTCKVYKDGMDKDTTNTIQIMLKPSMFSKYAFFSDNENSVSWTVGDTAWGPVHTNNNFNVANRPVFYGKVTIGGSEVKASGASPQYLGGLQKNIKIPIPVNGVSNVATACAVSPGGYKFTGNPLIYLDFRGDSIRYRFNTTGAYTYVLASAFTPNGIIYCETAEVHITGNANGNVKGKYTIAASGTATGLTGTGNIIIEDDILLNQNPQTIPSSTDMLGICAQKNIVIARNTANDAGLTIQACMYAQEGSFTANQYDTRPIATLQMLGGITQKTRGAVSTFSGGTLSTGFYKRYKYDVRLADSYPPGYPGCGTFEIVSWFE